MLSASDMFSGLAKIWIFLVIFFNSTVKMYGPYDVNDTQNSQIFRKNLMFVKILKWDVELNDYLSGIRVEGMEEIW